MSSTNSAALSDECCIDKERQLKQEIKPENVKVVVKFPPSIRAQIETQTERLQNESRRRKQVFDVICALIDPVSEEFMLSQLNTLDTTSWNEIVEERFLGRLCGYPVCQTSIQVDFTKKFVVNKRKNKVYETGHEENKYCSDRCILLSRAIRSQLYDEPLWLTGIRKERKYVVPKDAANFLNEQNQTTKQFKSSVPDLVRHIEELYIADRPSPDEDENEFIREDDNESGIQEEERDEREFLESIQRYNPKLNK